MADTMNTFGFHVDNTIGATTQRNLSTTNGWVVDGEVNKKLSEGKYQ